MKVSFAFNTDENQTASQPIKDFKTRESNRYLILDLDEIKGTTSFSKSDKDGLPDEIFEAQSTYIVTNIYVQVEIRFQVPSK